MELLTVRETAKITREGVSTVYLRIQRGELPHVRFGKSVRVPREALEEWLQTQIIMPSRPVGE